MTGFAEAYLAELAASVTASVLAKAFDVVAEKAAPDREQALGRCVDAGIRAMAEEIAVARRHSSKGKQELVAEVLDWFFGEETRDRVAVVLARLVHEKTLDADELLEILGRAKLTANTFPGLDFAAAVQALEKAFIQQVDREPAVRDEARNALQRHDSEIQTRQLAVQEKLLETALAKRQPAGGPSPALRSYLENLRREMRRLPLDKLREQASGYLREVTLDRIFIPLDTTSRVAVEGKGEKVKSERHSFEAKKTRPLSAHEAAVANRELVLLGDPGSGKSSFVKQVCAELAGAALGEGKPPEGFEENLVPIFVELRRLLDPLRELLLGSPSREDGEDREKRLARWLKDQIQRVAGEVAEVDAAGRDVLDALQAQRCLLVLDGLDEIPGSMRALVQEVARASFVRLKLARFLVTCRSRSYSFLDPETGKEQGLFPGVPALTLAELDEPKVRKFAADWYRALSDLGQLKGKDPEREAEDLAEKALEPHLSQLGSNPMLLTTLALLHQVTELPREKVKVLDRALKVLAFKWRDPEAHGSKISESLSKVLQNDSKRQEVLQHLAYAVHKAQAEAAPTSAAPPEKERGELSQENAVKLLSARRLLGDESLAKELLDYVDQRAGIFIGLGGSSKQPSAYTFPHRLFQDYLAGRYVFAASNRLDEISARAGEGDFWQQAIQLGAEHRFHLCDDAYHLRDLVLLLLPQKFDATLAKHSRLAVWAGAIAHLVGEACFCDLETPQDGAEFLRRLKDCLVKVLCGSALPAKERAKAGRLLGRLGDPRDELRTIEDMELCWVPKGPFFMGAAPGDEEALSDEKPGGAYEIPYGYWIGRHPVTQAQFRAFEADGGYEAERYWVEAKADGVWKEGRVKGYFDHESRVGAAQVGEPFSLPNHPVVQITWYEMLAYCRWLTAKARAAGWIEEGWRFALPSEPEWEKSARGGLELPPALDSQRLGSGVGVGAGVVEPNRLPERVHPFEAELGPELANYDEARVGSTSTPGCFSAGESPYGCQDLVGNVWEWTRSQWEERYPYPSGAEAAGAREALDAGQQRPRVLRGGSFAFDRQNVRCSARFRDIPDYRLRYIGFRVVLLPYFSEL